MCLVCVGKNNCLYLPPGLDKESDALNTMQRINHKNQLRLQISGRNTQLNWKLLTGASEKNTTNSPEMFLGVCLSKSLRGWFVLQHLLLTKTQQPSPRALWVRSRVKPDTEALGCEAHPQRAGSSHTSPGQCPVATGVGHGEAEPTADGPVPPTLLHASLPWPTC